MTFTAAIATLTGYYGKPRPPRVRDPFQMVLLELSAELASDEKRQAAFDALESRIGLTPAAILAASPAKLLDVTKLGGMQPENRARRMKDAAALAATLDFRAVLKLPLKEAKRTLRKFPSVGEPMTDRILMTSRAHPVLSLDSNGLRVLQRLGFAAPQRDYATSYRAMQEAVTPQLPRGYPALIAAHQLLRRHGRELCKTSRPLCGQCPLERECPAVLTFRS